MNNPTKTSEFLADDTFIVSNPKGASKTNDGSLVGLSKDPNSHDALNKIATYNHQIERIDNVYSPDYKDDRYILDGYVNAPYTKLRNFKYDTRDENKAVVQSKAKIGDLSGRTNRPTTHFSRKQQARFRNEICQVNPDKILYRPYFITLTSTPYVYELRETGIHGAVAEFCKDGLDRWKERLRRHQVYRHLTGMYKWEHTKSELPHLHWLCWFALWKGDPETPENEMLDYEWISRSWFECLFPTEELREQNYKHLEAGTQTQPLKGSKKKKKQLQLNQENESFPSEYTTDEFENDKNKLEHMPLEDIGEDIQVSGNYISKYIGKSEESVPSGWSGTFVGVINRHAYNSCKIHVEIEFEEKEHGQAVHSTMVKLDNKRITKHVECSNNLNYLIKREEQKVYFEGDRPNDALLQDDIKFIDQEKDSAIERTFLKRWERTRDENGLITSTNHNLVINEDLDANGISNNYLTEFKDQVYDPSGNYVGVYEAITSSVQPSIDNSLSGYQLENGISDLSRRVMYANLNGVDSDGCHDKTTFVLHNQGEIIEEHTNWTDIKARRLSNEDEYRYKTSRYFRGKNFVDLLKLTFPNSRFVITNYVEQEISLDVNNFYKTTEVKLCLNIQPQETAITEQTVLLE